MPKPQIRILGVQKQWGSGHHFEHLLVQDQSEEVQERHVTSSKAQKSHNKLETKDFGVLGVGRGGGSV